MDKVTRVKRKLMFEKLTSTKVLEINIPNPILENVLISKIVQVLQKLCCNEAFRTFSSLQDCTGASKAGSRPSNGWECLVHPVVNSKE
ncbi:hypothetical protein HMPREF1981_01442 [Bacteroides pyogenes F0041]|uniref:Uncharacterized protein n=1 Tax=Bacteroides pyogenes F0041 TaxID=1321819 RepID=U2CNU1_9BACE|nr:hypothetical protein HMPREF1981_01442 [Bacteroides pyogenes F0041]